MITFSIYRLIYIWDFLIMGQSLTKFLTDYCDVATNVRAFVGRKRRRDESEDQDSDSDLLLEKTLHTPKK